MSHTAVLFFSHRPSDATRLIPGGRSITMTETEGEARYWAANVNLVKDRGADWYAGRLSYTLSRLRNNTDDVNFRVEDANDVEDEWGPSVNDRRHVVSAVGSVYPTDRLRMTLASLLQSGQSVQYAWPVAAGRVGVRADVFNTKNLSGFANNATQSNRIQVGPLGSDIREKNAGPPRQFQFGLRYEF